jgi:hypothetical protein
MGKLLKLTREGHLESFDLKERRRVPLCAASHPCAKPTHIHHLVRWHTDPDRNFFYIELSVLKVQSRCKATGPLRAGAIGLEQPRGLQFSSTFQLWS